MTRKAKQVKNPGKAKAVNPASEIVCGFHAVGSAIRRAPADVMRLWVDKDRHDQRLTRLVDEAKNCGISAHRTDKVALDQKAAGLRHQGVLAELSTHEISSETDLYDFLESVQHHPLVLVLDQIQDPHNLGACLRTAEGAGVDAVVLPKDGAAPVNQTVRRVAAGAADRVPVYYVVNLARCLEFLKQAGFWIFGAADGGATQLYDLAFTGSTAIVMGAEGKGLRRLTREHCDQIVRIPMSGTVSSLNVSVATGVMLFEVVRQRKVGS
ncbi:MAG: 23S rRNA (guanosine(2251)-2'-O)-methyltransferase RlmB [bacterium]